MECWMLEVKAYKATWQPHSYAGRTIEAALDYMRRFVLLYDIERRIPGLRVRRWVPATEPPGAGDVAYAEPSER